MGGGLTQDITLYGKWEASHFTYTIHNPGASKSEETPLYVGRVSMNNNVLNKTDVDKIKLERRSIVDWVDENNQSVFGDKSQITITNNIDIWPKANAASTLLTFFESNESSAKQIAESIVTPVTTTTSRTLPSPKSTTSKPLKHWHNKKEIKVKDEEGKEITVNAGSVFDNYKDYEFTSTSIDLYAEFDEEAKPTYSVSFYSTIGDAKNKTKPLKTFNQLSSINSYDVNIKELLLTSPDADHKFYGWCKYTDQTVLPTTRENVQISTASKVALDITSETSFIPVYVVKDGDAKINYNNGKWYGSDTPTATTMPVWKDIELSRDDIYNEIRKANNKTKDDVLKLSTGEEIAYFTQNAIVVASKVTIKDNDLISMDYAESTKMIVALDLNGGVFTYQNKDGTKYSSESIYLEMNKKTGEGEGYTFAEIYQKFVEDDRYQNLTASSDGWKLAGWLNENTQVKDTDKFNKSTVFTGNWIEEEPSDFWSDTWGTISNVANRGIDEFYKQYYKAFHSKKANGVDASPAKYGNDATEKESDTLPTTDEHGTFVGLEKKLTLNGFGTFRTRVIGQQKDRMKVDDTTSISTALTFDFIDMPMFGGINTTNNNYTNGVISTIYEPMIRASLPEVLKANLKKVNKPLLKFVNNTTWDPSYIERYMFLPSAYEVFGRIEGKEPSTATSASVGSAKSESVKFANSPYLIAYDWYSNVHNSAESRPSANSRVREHDLGNSDESAMSYRCKYTGTTVNSWWLRTPITSDYHPSGTEYSYFEFYVTANESQASKPGYGGIYAYDSTGSRALNFCFAIGLVK